MPASSPPLSLCFTVFVATCATACIENYQVGQNPLETDTAGGDSDDSGAEPTPGVCGDGVLDEGEACDDGDDDPENGCDLDCHPTAAVEWTRTDRGIVEQGAKALDVAIDPTGRIVVVGSERQADGADRGLVLVLDPGGEVVWRRAHPGPKQDNSMFADVEVDAGGRIFVAGGEVGPGNTTSLIRGFGPAAEELWTFRKAIPEPFGQARALAVGPEGLYSASNEAQFDGLVKLVVRRHDLLSGAATWESPDAEPMKEYAKDIVVSGARLAVAGTTVHLEGQVPHPLVAFFALDGTLLASDIDEQVEGEWYGVAPIGAAGDLMLAGYVRHEGAIGSDAVLRRVDADNQEVWTFYDDDASEMFEGVAARADETLVVTGAGRIGDSDDLYTYTRRFAGDGATIWSSQHLDAGPEMNEHGTGVALGPGVGVTAGVWWEDLSQSNGQRDPLNLWVRRFIDD
ncbi:hypothetical protein OV090_02145 [Nannocystis sp. RBIL2]|uniref:hypothetical protein n=1 Tax=Nannocystis sp. RBIL2 TaxID=2996788 RepID=UPI00226F0D03|nr:hypothetical protein [Nannocystis sp. RBIL2]MCY1063541.1 hypothetical protein [Nannocystis sp. RBIL2]